MCATNRSARSLAQNIPYIHELSLSLANGGVIFPPGEVGWQTGGLDIHSQCTDTQDVYLCFRKSGRIDAVACPEIRFLPRL